MIGNKMYRRLLERNRANNPRFEEEWSRCPYMVNVHTDRIGEQRWLMILTWCNEHFGPESRVTMRQEGHWHRSGVTVDGYCWYGFDTEERLNEFNRVWGHEAEQERATA